MNIYTRAIHYKNGDILTITEEELIAIQDAILKGNRWVRVQGEMVSADTIARIGSHHATAEIALRDYANEERALEMIGQSDVVDKRREFLTEAAIKHHATTHKKLLARTNKPRSELPEVLHWKDENGEIHYS
jgi:hypothetical protein